MSNNVLLHMLNETLNNQKLYLVQMMHSASYSKDPKIFFPIIH
jgi:hypothetical protein